MSSVLLLLLWACAGSVEVCNGEDDDGNGAIDDGLPLWTYAVDADGDGFGDPASTREECADPGDGWVRLATDCDDARSSVHPGAAEVCDGGDDDCDGVVDDGLDATWYADGDGDGFGDPAAPSTACTDPGAGFARNDADCDDADAHAWTGAAEVCDGLDNDCDGAVDEDVSTTWYVDADGDGHGDGATGTAACAWPGAGWVLLADDCDDADPSAWVDAPELCDGIDNDCDAQVDEGALDMAEYPADADGDGLGDAVLTTWGCAGPDNTFDCDDGDATEPVVVDRRADGMVADGSLAFPYVKVADAVAVATECVLVFPGSYTASIDFSGADLLLESTDGAGETLLFGGGSGSTFTFTHGETSAAEVRGFTISGGTGTSEIDETPSSCSSGHDCTEIVERRMGGGVFVDGAAPTFTDDVIAGNFLVPGFESECGDGCTRTLHTYGGGMFVGDTTGTLTLTGVVFANDTADHGGGLYVSNDADVVFHQGRFLTTRAHLDGGAIAVGGTGAASFTNTVIVHGLALEEGGGVYVEDGTVTVDNSVIVAGVAPTGGGIAAEGAADLTLTNSVVAWAGDGGGVHVGSGAHVTVGYADVFENDPENWDGLADPTGTDGVLAVDPQFASWIGDPEDDDDDLRLQPTSPLVDAGDPDAAHDDADGSRNDIGAYGGAGSDWGP